VKNFRTWGKPPYKVAVVHGGPGAPGSVTPVARELAKFMDVLEPLQTKDSVEGQIEELRDVLEKYADLPAVLIGHSWGATLSYMTTAGYPTLVKKLILIGTPPLEAKNRLDLTSIWLDRLSEEERVEFASLENFVWDGAAEDKSVSMGRLFRLIAKGDSYDQIPSKDEVLEYQLEINVSIFRDLGKLQMSVDIVELGRGIACPVVAIHGDYDPRPAEAAKEPLSRVIKDFRFILLEKCGHYPWMERHARDEFFKVLRREIE
jgi:pimeloyl-ACP methyl ester carboxylesterase